MNNQNDPHAASLAKPQLQLQSLHLHIKLFALSCFGAHLRGNKNYFILIMCPIPWKSLFTLQEDESEFPSAFLLNIPWYNVYDCGFEL